MITQLILQIFNVVITGVIGVLPAVEELPFGIDLLLIQGFGYLHYMSDVFPPINTLLDAILFVISFKLFLKLVAMVPLVRGLLHK